MERTGAMRTDLFDFELPAASIALRPASPRDSARMLIVHPDGVLRDRVVADLPQWLEPGDQLVVNDTKVIAAQLQGRRIGRDTEPKIEATLIKRLDGSRWQALVKPARKLSPGDVVRFGNEGRVCLLGHLDAQVEHKGDDGEITLSFSFHGPTLDQAIADLGSAAVAALHRLQARAGRARCRRLSDHVRGQRRRSRGADGRIAFHPGAGSGVAATRCRHAPDHVACRGRDLSAGQGGRHRRAQDAFRMGQRLRATPRTRSMRHEQQAGRIVAVGTTSLRLLESAAAEDGTIEPFTGETAIFITPGYRFRAVDILLTNFHLPRSTLFMLVSAFSGLETMKRAYAHAIESGYRFYSYGDACLLFRDKSSE